MESAGLVCELRVSRAGRERSQPYPAARVVLQNLSSEPITIEWRERVLEHLRLVLSTAAGETVVGLRETLPAGSEPRPARTLTLAPGESYEDDVDLLNQIPPDEVPAGHCTVQAVFECGGVRAASRPIEFRVRRARPT
jgi:hypothetical protein